MTDITRVLSPRIDLIMANGNTLTGRLENFLAAKSLVIFDDEDLVPKVLTVSSLEAPAEHAALEADQVLLRNWTEMRGAAASLADQGIIHLTGDAVGVGMFKLQALVARVL
jgi:hypothetical protein